MSATYHCEDGIAHIDFDDGKANAMSLANFEALNAAFDQAEADKAITILSGREGIFSAGFHLGELAAGPETALALLRAGAHFCLRLLQFPTPVICACTGHAYPMGAFLLMSADYRLGIGGEFKLGMNEVRIGLTVPKFAVEVARGRLSPPYFNRTAITGELFSPADAVNAGILDRLVDEGELAAAASAVAEDFRQVGLDDHHATKLRVREPWIAAVQHATDDELTEEMARKLFGQ